MFVELKYYLALLAIVHRLHEFIPSCRTDELPYKHFIICPAHIMIMASNSIYNNNSEQRLLLMKFKSSYQINVVYIF